jgi:NifU-like protein involved in Fe-S cluster formation
MEMQLLPLSLQERIKKPFHRGQLTRQDSSERQLGLLSAGDGEGKLYFLVHPESQKVEKAKFLSYGALESILTFDAYCHLAEGRTISELSEITDEDLLHELTPLKGVGFSKLLELGSTVAEGLPEMKVEAPPTEAASYKRKDKEDMSEQDLQWLPLSAPQKIAAVEPLLGSTLLARTKLSPSMVELYNVQRDTVVQLKFKEDVEVKDRPLVMQFIESTLQAELHPEIRVEEIQVEGLGL